MQPCPIPGGVLLFVGIGTQGFVKGILDFSTDQQLGEFVIITGRKYPVGEEDINKVIFWIYPRKDAGKAGVAKAEVEACSDAIKVNKSVVNKR